MSAHFIHKVSSLIAEIFHRSINNDKPSQKVVNLVVIKSEKIFPFPKAGGKRISRG